MPVLCQLLHQLVLVRRQFDVVQVQRGRLEPVGHHVAVGVKGAGHTDQVHTVIGRTTFVVFQRIIQEEPDIGRVAQIAWAETLTS